MDVEFKISVTKFALIPLLVLTVVMILGAEIYFRYGIGISFFTAVAVTDSLLTVVKIFAQIWLVLPTMFFIRTLMKVSVNDRGIWGRDSWGRWRFIECSNIAMICKSKFGFYYSVCSDNGTSISVPSWVVKDNRFVLWAKNNGVCI